MGGQNSKEGECGMVSKFADGRYTITWGRTGKTQEVRADSWKKVVVRRSKCDKANRLPKRSRSMPDIMEVFDSKDSTRDNASFPLLLEMKSPDLPQDLSKAANTVLIPKQLANDSKEKSSW